MTNQGLAKRLLDAELRGDCDEIVYAENEILARLDVPLDETEQGLTSNAARAIQNFCKQAGVR